MREKGLTLIEVILVASLIAVVAGALVQVGTMALRTSDAGRLHAQAVGLTKEALETARAKRDEDSEAFFNYSTGYYSLEGGSFNLQAGSCSPPCSAFAVSGYSDFYREIHFTNNDPKMEVVVKTHWLGQGGHFSQVKSGTVLTKWR